MKIGLFLGVTCAIVLHVGVILFGGLAFVGHKKDYGTLQQVELLSENDAAAKKDKPKDRPKQESKEQERTEKKDAMETETEQAPDAAEMVRNLELSAAASAPALEAASLGAIEAALGGQTIGGGGDFAEVVTFSSGGRIGGMAKAGGSTENVEREFDLTEIDQKPRPIIQGAPVYPAAMRGAKTEGVVTVLFIVDATGKVSNPRIDKSTHPAFEKPAIDAVRQWKFEPAVRAGQRVPCKMRVPIRFQPR